MYTIINRKKQDLSFNLDHPIFNKCMVTGPGLIFKALGLLGRPLFIVDTFDILDIPSFAKANNLLTINKQIDLYADHYGIFAFKTLPPFSAIHKTDLLHGPKGTFTDLDLDLLADIIHQSFNPSKQMLPDYAGIIALHTLHAPWIDYSIDWLNELWYNSQALKEKSTPFPHDLTSQQILTKIALT